MTLDQKFKAVLEGVMPPMFLSETEFAELQMRVFDAVARKSTPHDCAPGVQ